jgi:hypothetical protein
MRLDVKSSLASTSLEMKGSPVRVPASAPPVAGRLVAAIAVLLVLASGAAAAIMELSPGEARAQAQKARHRWVYEITSRGKRGRANPHPVRFANPTRASFLAALQKASTRYHFTVLKVRFYKPLQLAPFVLVRSANPLRFSRDTPTILRGLDPKRRTADDRTGWAWEGFYLEARDAKGVPFLAVFNFWRGAHAGGGEWASDESLYPFPHG